MSLKGTVRNGVIVIEGNKKLPEGTEVEVVMESELLGKDLAEFVGTLTGPKDFARQHDHYIHGKPKK